MHHPPPAPARRKRQRTREHTTSHLKVPRSPNTAHKYFRRIYISPETMSFRLMEPSGTASVPNYRVGASWIRLRETLVTLLLAGSWIYVSAFQSATTATCRASCRWDTARVHARTFFYLISLGARWRKKKLALRRRSLNVRVGKKKFWMVIVLSEQTFARIFLRNSKSTILIFIRNSSFFFFLPTRMFIWNYDFARQWQRRRNNVISFTTEHGCFNYVLRNHRRF